MSASSLRSSKGQGVSGKEEGRDLAADRVERLDEPEEMVAKAWAREIRQRIREVESGAVKTISWSEVRKGILGLRDAEQFRPRNRCCHARGGRQ